MTQRPKHVLEYAALRSVATVVRILPYRAALLVGWLIAAASYVIARGRVREARERLHDAFDARFSKREIGRIAWRSCRNFFFAVTELMQLDRFDRRWMETHVLDYEQTAQTLRRRAGEGAVLASPHMGAWILGGAAMQRAGLPVFFITGRQKNPLTDAYLNRLRGSTGIQTFPRGSSILKAVARRLREGGVLGILADVRMPSEGIRVQFFGRGINVAPGAALFARMADVPVYPTIVTRVGWTRHRIRFGDPVRPDRTLGREEDWRRMTQCLFDGMEEAIRDAPGQWFWYNKRWILDPPPPQGYKAGSGATQAGRRQP